MTFNSFPFCLIYLLNKYNKLSTNYHWRSWKLTVLECMTTDLDRVGGGVQGFITYIEVQILHSLTKTSYCLVSNFSRLLDSDAGRHDELRFCVPCKSHLCVTVNRSLQVSLGYQTYINIYTQRRLWRLFKKLHSYVT